MYTLSLHGTVTCIHKYDRMRVHLVDRILVPDITSKSALALPKSWRTSRTSALGAVAHPSTIYEIRLFCFLRGGAAVLRLGASKAQRTGLFTILCTRVGSVPQLPPAKKAGTEHSMYIGIYGITSSSQVIQTVEGIGESRFRATIWMHAQNVSRFTGCTECTIRMHVPQPVHRSKVKQPFAMQNLHPVLLSCVRDLWQLLRERPSTDDVARTRLQVILVLGPPYPELRI